MVRGLVRGHGDHRLVTLFLVNGQIAFEGRSVERWLAQTGLSVRAPDGAAVFVRRAIDAVGLAPDVDKVELAGLEMLHRDAVELAVGHGVGVETTASTDTPGRGVLVATTPMPAQEVPRTDAPQAADFAKQRPSPTRSRGRRGRWTCSASPTPTPPSCPPC